MEEVDRSFGEQFEQNQNLKLPGLTAQDPAADRTEKEKPSVPTIGSAAPEDEWLQLIISDLVTGGVLEPFFEDDDRAPAGPRREHEPFLLFSVGEKKRKLLIKNQTIQDLLHAEIAADQEAKARRRAQAATLGALAMDDKKEMAEQAEMKHKE